MAIYHQEKNVRFYPKGFTTNTMMSGGTGPQFYFINLLISFINVSNLLLLVVRPDVTYVPPPGL